MFLNDFDDDFKQEAVTRVHLSETKKPKKVTKVHLSEEVDDLEPVKQNVRIRDLELELEEERKKHSKQEAVTKVQLSEEVEPIRYLETAPENPDDL
ncbi:MAG: hypothetical protein REH79_00230 [Spiroplasma sp.]|nr:hypothetical protein [Spiroplasma sp.]